MHKETAGQLMRWATRASVGVASSLVVAKAAVWWMSGSVALLGSLTDSALDLAASLVTMFAVKTALTPPDEDHRFGHGKAEALAGLFQASVMSGSAVFLILESFHHIWTPLPVAHSSLVMAVSVAGIVLSLGLVLFQAYVIRHTKSLAVRGDHLHYQGDMLLNLSVIAAAMMSEYGILAADGVFGVLIGLYILKSAYDIVRPAIDMLMDREFSLKDREKIFNIVMGNPDVLGLHELKTRSSGRDKFIQMHIEVPAEMTVKAAHLVADEVEATVGEAFPDSEILIHIDPPDELAVDRTLEELPPLKEEI
ncbi:cation diffusion facilitator family transporter [Kordiimonas marina]|uniref:cation diffusion facilitator family transporter n=1 Tax=Kordiimonas marina TaxID=2872312 RepID=UPI001FF44A37|nr:cation diffusion facilitator family transporter [Kordiimonas marina]MCJ9429395.1 cation diffusion facilitator family transporter [Kordiimonas marina]